MHPDLPYEQAYFDRALALRDRQQAGLARAPGMAANPRAVVELRKRVSRLGLADPDEAIAFGRIDADDSRWYIGKGAIWDDDNDLVVVNWQAPIAAPFYTATPDDPEGLDSRRLYRCTGNQIREIEDLMFREVAQAIAEGRPPEPVLSDALLDSLGTARSGELGDIVATIQAAQYDVISRPLDQLLVVQGGPGTGKTVVGLHRVSWLLYNRRDRLEPRDVLVVGPNPAFIRYVAAVLPSLGEEAVVQLPIRALGPTVRIGRVDPPELRRLKGDRRMLRLILRGLRNRQRVEASAPVELTVRGRRLTLDARRIATRARQLAGRPHNEAHRSLRVFVTAEVRAALLRLGADDVEIRGEDARDIDAYLDRVWPRLTPQALLVDLLSSRRQLLGAGAGTFSDAELALLALPSDAKVSTWQWAVDDVPLLDAADALLNGVTATYEHIVVDEAQDLSPLQLESIRRRSRTGSMTVLGDLAQGTSPWAPDSWGTIVQGLRHERVAAASVELEHGYRLPAEAHAIAMRLLSRIAPGLARPRAVRCSGHDVLVASAGDVAGLPAQAVEVIAGLVGEGIVGVIVPPSLRPGLVAALDTAGIAWAGELRPPATSVVVLTPEEAKGLEFDVVVVVEPAALVDEAEHGLRSLFVALTRCTSRLAIVHARPLPAELGLGPAPDDAADGADELDTEGAVDEPAADEVSAPIEEPAMIEAEAERVDAEADEEWVEAQPERVELEAERVDADADGEWVEAQAERVDADADEERVEAEAERVEAEADEEWVERVEAQAWRVDADADEERVEAQPEAADADDADDPDGANDPDGAGGLDAETPVGLIDLTDLAPEVSDGGLEPEPEDESTEPLVDLVATLDALDDIEREVARAIAGVIAAKLAPLVSPTMLPLIGEEVARALSGDGVGTPRDPGK